MTSVQSGSVDERLLQCIRSEYSEMPGLSLTLEQASRLWNTDAATSVVVLEALVEEHFLRVSNKRYRRNDSAV
jgi:hypothetical protein